MSRLEISPHLRHRELVDSIERECRVAEWRSGDIDLWPLASQDLFGDIFRAAGAVTAERPPPFAIRAGITLATPALNLWKSRHDLAHWQSKPHRADAIFLGDGVSLDRVDGAWRDRFGEPIAQAFERQGRRCFVMQSGNLARLPWARPTHAANVIAARAALIAELTRSSAPRLPDHSAVIRLIESSGVASPSLSSERLARRARRVAAQAAAFERILHSVKPSVAFVVTYYAGVGHAFALACRRSGILCVDLQHCPHDAFHRAYRWSTLPTRGYSTLPGLFWTWTEKEASNIQRWSDSLSRPWHRAIAGGHPQIAGLRNGDGERLWKGASGHRGYEREILVALQPIGGKSEVWDALAGVIRSAPPGWRWWIRRHPASTSKQDRAYGRLLSLDESNVVIGEAAQIPLAALLGRMDALVSLASGTSAEAAILGVPAFFLDREACDTFPGLIARGEAEMMDLANLVCAIASLPTGRSRPPVFPGSIEDRLIEIDRLAMDYAGLCAQSGSREGRWRRAGRSKASAATRHATRGPQSLRVTHVREDRSPNRDP